MVFVNSVFQDTIFSSASLVVTTRGSLSSKSATVWFHAWAAFSLEGSEG